MNKAEHTISTRLSSVLNLAGSYEVYADVGCDHGKLSLSLLKAGARRVIMTDISAPSAQKARVLMQNAGIDAARYDVRVSDGFDMLGNADGIDCVIIAGMGGTTICGILERGLQRLRPKRLVIQAQNDIAEVRKAVIAKGYHVCAENVVLEREHEYRVMACEPGADGYMPENDAEWELGNILTCSDEPLDRFYVRSVRKDMAKRKVIDTLTNKAHKDAAAKGVTCRDIQTLAEEYAPLELQAGFDNCGLQVGDPNMAVGSVLLCLDCDMDTVRFAAQNGYDMIIAHHPLFLEERRSMTSADYSGRIALELARSGICLLSLHTCLDRAEGGTGDSLCELLGYTYAKGEGDHPYLRYIEFAGGMRAEDLCEEISRKLNTAVRMSGRGDKKIGKLFISTGSGGAERYNAARQGADAFLTGELKYHIAQECIDMGMYVFEAGHYETEFPAMRTLRNYLQKRFNELKYNLRLDLYTRTTSPYLAVCGKYEREGAQDTDIK